MYYYWVKLIVLRFVPSTQKKSIEVCTNFFFNTIEVFFILFIYIFWHKMRHLSRFIVFIQYIIYFSFYLLNKEKEIIDSWHTITCLNFFFTKKIDIYCKQKFHDSITSVCLLIITTTISSLFSTQLPCVLLTLSFDWLPFICVWRFLLP
jgi:hypothetical protein